MTWGSMVVVALEPSPVQMGWGGCKGNRCRGTQAARLWGLLEAQRL